jgi:hypothetical protein
MERIQERFLILSVLRILLSWLRKPYALVRYRNRFVLLPESIKEKLGYANISTSPGTFPVSMKS